jgi:hypothetical protein
VLRAVFSWVRTVANAWLSSLKMLLPGNLKLLALVTFKSIGTFYKQAGIYLSWLFCVYALIAYWYPTHLVFDVSLYSPKTGIAALLVFAYYLFARSSIDRKDLRYLRAYILKLAVLLALLYLFLGFLQLTLSVHATSHPLVPVLAISTVVSLLVLSAPLTINSLLISQIGQFFGVSGYLHLSLIVAWYLAPFFAFFVFFVYDTHDLRPGSIIKAVVRAWRMYFYNLPFCIITGVLLYTVFILVQSFMVMPLAAFVATFVGTTEVGTTELMRSWLVDVIMMALVPVGICWWATLYIKRARDQFSLYCGKQC